ncbi:MAG: serine/threonine-protein kinase [Myxococcota bacterium]
MAKVHDGPITKDTLVEETRFLLKTLLRDDLFGEEVSLTEAEKLLEASLTLGFVDYAAFLKKREYVVIDRTRNSVRVTAKGRLIADGMDDAEFHRELTAHFSSRLNAPAREPVVAPVANKVAPRPVTAAAEDLRDGRYTRLDPMGQGGLGTVFRGKNIYLSRDVAIKEFRHLFDYLTYLQRDEVLRKLRAAVMAQSGLHHPFVLEILDLNFDKDPPYVILDLASGGNLRARLDRAKAAGGQLPMPFATRLLFQVAYALHHAHSVGVVHGDLKPENILFDRAGNVKVGDFGVAGVVEKAPGQGPPVYVGVGNPSYLAPEQLHGTSSAVPASDVYSFGIVMYHVLTGNLPGRRSPMPSEVNAGCPKAIDSLFDMMTRDRLEERIGTMAEVLDGLYQAFPKEEVLERGHLILFEKDPYPPPAPVEQPAPAKQNDSVPPPPANGPVLVAAGAPAGNGAPAASAESGRSFMSPGNTEEVTDPGAQKR